MTTAPANEPSTVLRTVEEGNKEDENAAAAMERRRQQTEDMDDEQPITPSSTDGTAEQPMEATDACLASPSSENDAPHRPSGIKVLFLSSDTGGGHRASAESLGKQFELLFPGSTFSLLDVVEKDGVPPYNSLVSYYKHLSARPSQWKLVYSVSNSRAFELLADAHLKLMCERAVRKSIESYAPDVVVSVHPLMTNVPVLSCSKISQASGKHLPMFTVVTDLGSAHCLWFANSVEKMFVGSEAVYRLAQERGKVPEDKLVRTGLPIRHDFAVQAEQLGDRQSPEGIAYQAKLRLQLNLPPNKPTILLMGGGEGVGSLANITDALYAELVAQGMDAVILVVCGRNEKLQTSLAERDWDTVLRRHRRSTVSNASCATASPGCDDGFVTQRFRRMLTTSTLRNAIQFPSSLLEDEKAEMVEASIQVKSSIVDVSDETLPTEETTLGHVQVVGLGFVTNMAEYMVAADILVSKAGPGTISEAAAVSLPVLLTSFLPGQEEGNVEYVVEHGFGAYLADTDPVGIADEICDWIKHPDALAERSRKAGAVGTPHAARDIARAIGDSTLKWMELNQESGASSTTGSSSDESSK